MTYGVTVYLNQSPKTPAGVVLVPAGTFTLGTAGETPNRNEL